MNKLLGSYSKTIFWVSAIFCLFFVIISLTNTTAVETAFSGLFSFFTFNFG